jgi:leader peptidase (prepilin peptidase)/N-methyltransferase
MLIYLRKWLGGGQLSTSDREIPYGPYLSMAAAVLFFAWPMLWRGWAEGLFRTLYEVFWFLLGIETSPLKAR